LRVLHFVVIGLGQDRRVGKGWCDAGA